MNHVDQIKNWWLLFHIAGDINNEQWLINWGLDEKKKWMSKQRKIIEIKALVLRAKVIF